MNIKDIQAAIDRGEVEIPEGDMLELIFENQDELIKKYEPIESSRGAMTIPRNMFGALNHRRVQWRIKDLSQRTVEELMEAMNTLRNKPWKQSEVEVDVDHFKEELADTLHFFIELCITAGIDAKELFALYFKKKLINEFRQRSQY